MVIVIGNPENSNKNANKNHNKYGKVVGYKINIENLLHLLMKTVKLKRNQNEPSYNTIKGIKCLEITLTKEVKVIYLGPGGGAGG